MVDALIRVSPNEKTEIKGIDVTIHELTPEVSRIQVESHTEGNTTGKDNSATYSVDVGMLA